MTPHPSLLSNTCGRCNTGEIFSHFFWLNAKCTHCGHRFENEQGHYIGAMIIAYFVTVFLALPPLLISVFIYKAEFVTMIWFASAQVIITGPVFYRYSKLIWIHMEERISNHLNQEKSK